MAWHRAQHPAGSVPALICLATGDTCAPSAGARGCTLHSGAGKRKRGPPRAPVRDKINKCSKKGAAGVPGPQPRSNPTPPNPTRPRLTVAAVHNLEVFNGGVGDAAVEVEDVGLGLVVPHRRLVVQLDHVVHVLVLPSHEEAVVVLGRARGDGKGEVCPPSRSLATPVAFPKGCPVPGCSPTHCPMAGPRWEKGESPEENIWTLTLISASQRGAFDFRNTPKSLCAPNWLKPETIPNKSCLWGRSGPSPVWPLAAPTYISGPDGHPLVIRVHPRDDDRHLAGPFEPQDVRLLQEKPRP